MMTFDRVSEIFDALYAELRELNGENAPDSFTWIAPDRDGLVDATGGRCEDDEPIISTVGGGDGPAVAWAWECNAETFFRIDPAATDAQVEYALRACMNMLPDPSAEPAD